MVPSIGVIMFHCFFGQLLAERYALRLINLYKSLILQKKLLHQSLKVKKRARKAKAKRKKRTADKECTGQPKLAADEQKNIEQKNMLLITRYVLMLVIISSLQNSLEV